MNFKAMFGIRHFQVFLMGGTMLIGSAVDFSMSIAIIAMTDTSPNSDIKVSFFLS